MVGQGHKEHEILEWPLDKFYAYSRSLTRVDVQDRSARVIDMAASIGGAFSKGGVKDYLKEIEKLPE